MSVYVIIIFHVLMSPYNVICIQSGRPRIIPQDHCYDRSEEAGGENITEGDKKEDGDGEGIQTSEGKCRMKVIPSGQTLRY